LVTVCSHDQYNTTIYGLDDRYRGIRGRRLVVFLHPEDMHTRGLKASARVDLISEAEDGVLRRATGFEVVPYDIPRGCAGAYFPETNVLVPIDSYADRSITPTSKLIPIRLFKAYVTEGERGFASDQGRNFAGCHPIDRRRTGGADSCQGAGVRLVRSPP